MTRAELRWSDDDFRTAYHILSAPINRSERMRMPRAVLGSLQAAIVLAVTACGDVVPTAPATTNGARAGVIGLELDAGRVDLDITKRELRHSDGRVVDLTVEETEQLATEFIELQALEAQAAYLATTYTSADDVAECDWHFQTCEDDFVREASAALDPASASAFSGPGDGRPELGAGPPWNDRADFERAYGRIKVRVSRRPPHSYLQGPAPGDQMSYFGFSCADVRRAMDEAREAAGKRKVTVGDAIRTVISWVSFKFVNGIPRGTFGTSERSVLRDLVTGAETGRTRIAMDLLQALYVQMGCSSVNDGGQEYPTLPPGYKYECEYNWGTLLVDGKSVYSGWMKTCKAVKAS